MFKAITLNLAAVVIQNCSDNESIYHDTLNAAQPKFHQTDQTEVKMLKKNWQRARKGNCVHVVISYPQVNFHKCKKTQLAEGKRI